MSKFELGQTDVTVYFRAYDADGVGVSGILYNATGLLIGYLRERGLPVEAEVGGSPAPVSIAADDAHSNWGFVNVIDNLYRVDVPDGYMDATGSPKFGIVYVGLPDHTFVREHVDEAHVGNPRDVGDAVMMATPGNYFGADDSFGQSFAWLVVGALLRFGVVGGTGNGTTAIHLLDAGGNDDLFNDHMVVVLDVSDSYKPHVFYLDDYVGSTEVGTMVDQGFTPAAGDPFTILTRKRTGLRLDATGIAAIMAAEVNLLDGVVNGETTLEIGGETFTLTRLARNPIATMVKD